MDIFIMLAIVIANLIAVLLIYQFIKKLPKVEKILFIGVSFAIIYVLVSIACWISGFGIDSRVNEAAKDFIVYTFVPVNVILLIPFVATKYNKLRFKEIEKSEFVKRLIIVGIVGVIILTWECFYFKRIKQNIEATMQSVELDGQEYDASEDLESRNGVYTNDISENTTNGEVVNGISVNITNEEVVNEISVNITNEEVVNEILINKENNTLNENYLE